MTKLDGHRFLIGLAILLLSSSLIASKIKDDLTIVRENVRKIMLWPSNDELQNVLTQATANLTFLNLTTCKWPDLNYSTRGPENWDPVLHMFRVSTMVAAFTVPGGLGNNTKLEIAIHCALNVWLNEDWQNPNWWWNYIQDPLIANGIMLMLGVESMTEYEIESIVNMSYRANWWIKDWGGGANLVWELQVQLYRALSTSNYSAVSEAFDLMWQTVQVQNLTTMGIQSDWSYHFHGSQILTAAYGDAWATNILHFHLATKNTQYALSKDRIEVFGQFLTEGDAWLTMGSAWTWGVIGRVIDRGVHVWYTHLFPPDQLRELAMDVMSNSTALALEDYANRLEHRHQSKALVGNRHFYTSDFQVHRRINWTVALKMHSIRTIATECDNYENLKGEHIGDGVLNLYTRDAQYGTGEEYENIFALLDWQAINGATVEADTPLVSCTGSTLHMLSTAFVGGVSDGMYGAAFMDTATHNLTAKRTWHFYDDFIIALANEIVDETKSSLQTGLASRLLPMDDSKSGLLTVHWSNGTLMRLSDGIYSFHYNYVHVDWFHIDGTVWIVLEPYEILKIECQNKTDNFNKIGPWNFEMNGRLLSAVIIHGQGPTLKSLNYKYMIIPNITMDAFSNLSERYMSLGSQSSASTITNNDSSVFHIHGSCNPFVQRASVIFFDTNVTRISNVPSFSCSQMSLDIHMEQAGAILFVENSNNFTITAAHPTTSVGLFIVDINRSSISTSYCTNNSRWGSQNGTRVLIDLPGTSELLGKSVSVTCQKPTPV